MVDAVRLYHYNYTFLLKDTTNYTLLLNESSLAVFHDVPDVTLKEIHVVVFMKQAMPCLEQPKK